MNPSVLPLKPSNLVIPWDDASRATAFAVWLSTVASPQGLLPATVRPASADASFRRYFRVDSISGASFIIMDAPPGKEDCKPFVNVAGLMAAAGLNVPHIVAWDEQLGFMLLTDLGAKTMMEVIDPDVPGANFALYMQAVDTLIDWQLASQSAVLPPYDEALLRRELALFPDWYLAKYRNVSLDAVQQTTLDKAFDLIVQRNLAVPRVYVHRDFMPRNLMAPTLVASRTARPEAQLICGGPVSNPLVSNDTRLGVLDFQDAVYGPITYDIASLMRDAFLSWEEPFVLDITIRY